jgi:small-conductance mechanosensitive channel
MTYLFSFFLSFLSFRFVFSEIQLVAEIPVLQIKYMILLNQEVVIACIVKFIYLRFFNIQIFKYRSSFIVLGLYIILFMIGLGGYLDLIINLNYIVLIDSLLIFWALIFTHLKSSILHQFHQPKLALNQYLKKYFSFNAAKIIFNIKVVVYSIYIFSIFILLATFIFETFWIIPIAKVESFYHFFFLNHTISIMGYYFRLNDIFIAFFSLFLLSALNLAISAYIAKKVSHVRIFQKKISQTLSSLGYFITAIIVLQLAGLVLENVFVIAGGILLAFAFAIKNVLSSLFSSLVIFINRPFQVGDLIAFQNIKGFVKKIALFEVTIETLDNNIVHIPNKSIEYSTLENFTFQHKTQHKVHINYLLNQFNLKQEKKLTQQLTEIIQNHSDVVSNQKNSIEILFSPESKTKDCYNLEIIFMMKNLKQINKSVNLINLKILEKFVHLKIDGQFVSTKHPLS